MRKDFIKSMLFVPAHKENFLNKLDKLTSDAVVIDLEDAVPTNKKNLARKSLEKINKSKFSKNLFVRINNDPKNLLPDIISSTKAKIDSYVFPKIDSSYDVKFIEKKIKKYSKLKKLNFFILIESSKAIINLKEICTSSKNIKGLIFGAEDFLNNLNILEFYDDTDIDFPRALIPIYANAFNLNCIDTPYLNLTNLNKFKSHLKKSKNLGYTGLLNIHPKQCKLTNQNYSPSKENYNIAKKILNSNKSQRYQNQNISVLKNKLVGPPLIKRAKKIVDYFDE
jgi:citrate lyase subunit beta/citryl-CoA lyase